MNTDKNGWPYIIVVLGIVSSVSFLVAISDNAILCLFGGFALVWFWSCMGLFLNLTFSEQMKMTPIHKKFVFAFFPMMYLSKPSRDWFLKEFNDARGSRNS